MKKLLAFLVFAFVVKNVWSQGDTVSSYRLTTAMIPMRDACKVVRFNTHSCQFQTANSDFDTANTIWGNFATPGFNPVSVPYLSGMASEGYIFVYQDIRGKYKSEGNMQIT